MTHHLKRKAVWNSTHEQIKADMKWHTQTLLGKKKQSKEEDYLKKGSTTHCTSYINNNNYYFSGWPWCYAMRKLMFSKSMFCLFLWQLVQVLLWFKIRPSGTFLFFIFNFSPISDWGYQKVSLDCWMFLQDILISPCTHHPIPTTIIVFRVSN